MVWISPQVTACSGSSVSGNVSSILKIRSAAPYASKRLVTTKVRLKEEDREAVAAKEIAMVPTGLSMPFDARYPAHTRISILAKVDEKVRERGNGLAVKGKS